MMRIAQVSDIHITLPSFQAHRDNDPRYSASVILPLLRAVFSRLLDPDTDLIALTGDLLDIPAENLDGPESDTGNSGPLERESLAVYSELKSPLEACRCRYIVLPGNHDHPAAFRRIFGNGGRETILQGYHVLSFWDDEGRNHIPERINGERARFEAALQTGPAMSQIHLQHYPINEVDNSSYPHNYADHRIIREATAASGRVSLAASGHYHPGTPLVESGGAIFTVCPGFLNPGRPFRLYTITGTGVAMEECSAED